MIKKRYRQNKLLEAKEIKHKISDPYDSGHNQMETHHIDAFREILIALRSELEQLQAAGSEAAETVTLDQAKVGRLSRMDAMQAQQMAEETARRRQLQLQRIDCALRRIEAGDYGYCFKCGDEIWEARLRIDPTSTRCMACMEH